MKSNISYDEGRYIAKLPCKDDHLPLPTNYDVNVGRTENLIKRLRKTPLMLQKYDEKDRNVTRFLWLSDPSDPDSPLTTYRFKAVLFGATCSPFILCATIIKHLENNSDNRHTSRMYDPLGLLIPVTIRAKIILQELWKKKYAWDSPLPRELQQKWQEIARDMNRTDHCDEPEPQSPSESSTNTITGIHDIIDMTRYSTLGKLLLVSAYVLRFAQNCRLEVSSRRLEHLTASELQQTEELWLRSCQQSTYGEEIKNLSSNGNRLPLVRHLRLFLDATGFVRCGGHIHNAPLSEKFPYLLPQKHPFARLVVIDAHERLLHSGSSLTITYLRQKYWIPVIRRCVQSVLRACVICRRVNGNSYHAPDPPPLPKIRVEDTEPYTATGVDFTCALYVRDKDGQEKKAYSCLFTCASTRAVHIELVPDFTTETFLQAFLRRFRSRKSLLRLMISKSTTYIGAANHLRELMQSNAVQEELNNKGTEWRFIVKPAAWYGRWWERLIGLTKTAVKKVLGRSYVDSETLSTIITEVGAVINDRPLTYVTFGEVETEPLTPSHLLFGRRLTKLPYSEDIELPGPRASNFENITKRARTQKKLIDNFRVRWKPEHLTAIREHHRVSGKKQQTIKFDDVVQVHNETPRSSWKLAVMEETITENDGLVRAARIRTQNGHHTTRPIVELYPLEVLCDTVSARD
ncbi:uncharacterized protein LOC128204293 [Mya arenaria]|uniref:uncharacterized protein LOC128204293 n=1 Tax=Mya arenaria TaxID=6604 RepID=UPI0022E1EC47|nr:uncharacterized protein LOC128204293 [Mya arenaria]